MDARAPVSRFGPDRRLTAATGTLALIALASAALTTDPAGRVLLGGAVLVLLAYTVTDLVFWPRLSVDGAGLLVHTPAMRARIPWADIESVHADARARLGLRSITLEIDAGERLVVFSRRSLGADPATVAELIAAYAPHPE